MVREIKMVDVDLLVPHILSTEIYGNPEDNQNELNELMTDIGSNGMLQPLIVDQDMQVISGARRLVAARLLGHETVPIEQLAFANEQHRIAWLIGQNTYRTKTTAAKIKEAKYVESMYNEYARARKQGREIDDEEVLEGIARADGKIVARDEAGKAIGFSPRSYADGKTAVNIAEKFRALGEEDKAQAIEEKLEVSVSGAKTLAKELEKPPKEVTPHDILYWYMDDLQHIVSILKRKVIQLRKKSNSTTPAALSMFFSNLDSMRERIMTWYPDNMEECNLCKGTGFTNETVCTNCIQGKVGGYRIPTPEHFVEGKDCAICGKPIGILDSEVIEKDGVIICGECAMTDDDPKEM